MAAVFAGVLCGWVDVVGDVATWAAAIGTISAVVVALRLARRDRGQHEYERRRHQAEMVTVWLTGEEQAEEHSILQRIAIQNASNQCIYETVVSLVAIQGAFRDDARDGSDYDFRAFPGQLPPGRTETWLASEGHGMQLRFGVEIAFRDAAGNSWRRRGDGRLEDIKEPPTDFYGIGQPVGWESG